MATPFVIFGEDFIAVDVFGSCCEDWAPRPCAVCARFDAVDELVQRQIAAGTYVIVDRP